MTNNDILRRLRYTFDYSDSKMIELFALGNLTTTLEEVSALLKKNDDPQLKSCADVTLASFLNGMIIENRGEREDGPPVVAEKKLTDNIILRKLKIALDLQAEQMMEILGEEGFEISKHELSAFFRRLGHKHFRECKDPVLRKFLKGIQRKYRDDKIEE